MTALIVGMEEPTHSPDSCDSFIRQKLEMIAGALRLMPPDHYAGLLNYRCNNDINNLHSATLPSSLFSKYNFIIINCQH